MAFPPFHEYRDGQSCPVIGYMSTVQKEPAGGNYFNSDSLSVSHYFSISGFYLDSSILQCDSYFGIALYVVSASCLLYTLLGYYYMFFSMVALVVKEFKTSKWVDVLEKLIRIKDEEERDYNVRIVVQHSSFSF